MLWRVALRCCFRFVEKSAPEKNGTRYRFLGVKGRAKTWTRMRFRSTTFLHQVFGLPTDPTFIRAAMATGMAKPFHGENALMCWWDS